MLMSNIVTPKGEMSAFQRWEMASFGDERPSHINEQAVRANAAAKIDQAEIERAREIARREGNTLGFKEGYAAGIAEGRNAGMADLDREIAYLQGMMENFSEQLGMANQAIGQDLLNLAIDLAQAMTRSTLECRPEVIIPIIREAIEHLPAIQQPAQIFLHPDDALIIKNNMRIEMDQAGWRLISDPHIERGGCKLETAQNLIDASFSTRWQRLTDALRNNATASGTS